MTDRHDLCDFCELAPARTQRLGRPSCSACADSVSAFYRGARFQLEAEVRGPVMVGVVTVVTGPMDAVDGLAHLLASHGARP